MSKRKLTFFLEKSMKEIKEQGLYNEIDCLQSGNGPIVTIKGETVINLSSNNYLGFSMREELIEASSSAARAFGVGTGAVRTINGTMSLHEELENKIACFKGTEAAIIFQSGFNCNMGAISAIMTKNDVILSDELNHASIIDGCRLSGAKIIRVKHQDMEDLREKAKLVSESGLYEKVMYITDGVFSMDGDIAKISDIVKIAKEYDLITYVDDAHGSGVLGDGAGTVKHFGESSNIDLQIGTLSKAIGCVGGYVAGRKEVIDWLKVRARPFLFSTSTPPSSVASAIAAIDLMEHDKLVINQLWDNANYLKLKLKELGFNIGISQTPITPILIGDEELTKKFSEKLLENKIYAKSIVYPTVPMRTGRIRNMPMATHTKEMLDEVIRAYEKVGTELKII